METDSHNVNAAYWLAPLASSIPLIPFFSLPASPLFLGRLGFGDAENPFLQPQWGPWLAAAGVIFDGTIMAYAMAFILYTFFRMTREPMTTRRVVVLSSLMGVLASQLVHAVQHFRQPALSAFADSWLSPIFGCICGLTSGACFALFAKWRFSLAARILFIHCPSLSSWRAGNFFFYLRNGECYPWPTFTPSCMIVSR